MCEEEYEEKISKEFEVVISNFQKQNKMENTSMIRLLSDERTNFTNKIDINY